MASKYRITFVRPRTAAIVGALAVGSVGAVSVALVASLVLLLMIVDPLSIDMFPLDTLFLLIPWTLGFVASMLVGAGLSALAAALYNNFRPLFGTISIRLSRAPYVRN
jgi:hypothetical protein